VLRIVNSTSDKKPTKARTIMKPRKNAFLFGGIALAMTCAAQAAQIDVCGVVTANPTPLAPVNATVGSGVRGVHAITSNQTWTADNEYFLTDRVFVPKGITLTIEPGTKIYGSTNDNGTPSNKADDKVGSLIAARGGRIIAEGTPDAPILFTAVAVWEAENNQDSIFDPNPGIGVVGNPNNGMPGPSDAGLWGGVVVLGNAYILHLDGTTGNNGGIALIEGFVPGSTPDDNGNGVPDAAEYGYDASGEFKRDDDDDSGVYRYLTISHGGYEFDSGREINGLTLGGVGARTRIDHIEVIANQDDGIEFFGGTVSTSHVFLAYNQDDNFDFDSGYTGSMQFFFSIQNPGFADGGFEHDGIEGTTATQGAYDAAFDTVDTVTGLHVPKAGITLTKPRLFNGTIIGPGRTNTFSTIAQGYGKVLTEKGNHGFIYDDYYNGDVYNSVIDDFSQDLVFFRDGAKSYGATAEARHNTLGRFGSAVNPQVDTATAAGTIGTAGNIAVTVTGALVAGSPLAVNVAAASGDAPADWAEKVRIALAALPAITTNYNITGSGTAIIISTKVNAANDTSLNIALANGTTTGVTAASTSANTVAGGSAASVNPALPTTYITGVNVRGLFMNGAGVPQGNNSAVNTNPMLTTYTRDSNNFLTAIDPRPAAGSPLLPANGATIQPGAPMQANFRGAFGPGPSDNWAAGWTKTWESGILQGGNSGGGDPPFVDSDNDGIDDALEVTPELAALGFVVGNDDSALFASIYTEDSILDLRTTAGVTVQKVGNTATLSVPVEKSTGLNSWSDAGNMTLNVDVTANPDKQFFRLEVKGAEVPE